MTERIGVEGLAIGNEMSSLPILKMIFKLSLPLFIHFSTTLKSNAFHVKLLQFAKSKLTSFEKITFSRLSCSTFSYKIN